LSDAAPTPLDPGQAIVGLVRAALGAQDGRMLKLFRKAGLDEIALGGLSFDVIKAGPGSGVTLSAALALLSDRLMAPFVLVIDEAQHAASTAAGNDALFALKAARDELNSSAHVGSSASAMGRNCWPGRPTSTLSTPQLRWPNTQSG
jgi:hypothetical protein